MIESLTRLALPAAVVRAALGLTIAASALASVHAAPIAERAVTISISGAVDHPTTLSAPELGRCEVHQLTRRAEHPATGSDGQPVDDHYSACLLRDVLNGVGMTPGARMDLRRSYILVTASDGYQVLYSWGEVFNSPLGDDIYLAFARNGAPIADAEGAFALFSVKDIKPGPRYARGVASIQVLRAGGPAP